MTVIILTNLLIAMMSDRFTKVMGSATAEWRIIFARQCHEYYDATMLPLPFNIIELVINACNSDEVEDDIHQFSGNDSETQPVWGRHYLWPIPANRFDMHMATTKLERQSVSGSEAEKLITDQLKGQQESLSLIHESQAKEKHHALEMRLKGPPKRASEAPESSAMTVDIVNKTSIVVNKALARELGVAALWKDGAEYSYVGYGVPICVDGPGTVLVDEGAIRSLFQPFGTVLAITRHAHQDGDNCWALVSFTNAGSALRAVEGVPTVGGRGLTARRLDVPALMMSDANEPGHAPHDPHHLQHNHASMARHLYEHNAIADMASRRGHILCETAGAADEIGERCVAVVLQCDGRVLLVRMSGVHEVKESAFSGLPITATKVPAAKLSFGDLVLQPRSKFGDLVLQRTKT